MKWREGNVFTPVCHSVHGGGEFTVPACITGRMTRWGLCPGEVSVQWGAFPGGLCLGGLCPGGPSPEGVFVQKGGLCPGRVSVRETPNTVKSRRYASYWNAFLLSSNFVLTEFAETNCDDSKLINCP